MINTIEIFALNRGCKNAYEFWKRSGLNQATAYRLWNNQDAYPSRDNQDAICKAFDAQPGDFLRHVSDSEVLHE